MFHHVMNRGARHQAIFRDDHDRRKFLRLLSEALELDACEVLAFCLVGNHYHLLVHTPSGGLSRLMQRVSQQYTQWFNFRWKLDGPLFKGRFHSVTVLDDRQLLATSRYIHRNAVDVGAEISTYRWSSMAAVIGNAPKPAWLTTDYIGEHYSTRQDYEHFVLADDEEPPAAAA